MSWFGFLSLSKLWLLALVVPIVVFYFLKLRRPRTEVASLALWRQVMNDQRVNSPFQKFKRNILLLLQLLLLLALTVAATQPYFQGDAASAEYIPVIIDRSASMAARDPESGKTRLALAKEQLHELIENLRTDQRLSVIAVGSTAKRLTDFTNNTRVLHEVVDQLEVLPVQSELIDGLRVTQALTKTQGVDRVLLLSDGNVPVGVPFQLPYTLDYRLLPPAGPNMGITEMNARRSGTAGWEVFVRVESSIAQPPGGTSTGNIKIAVNSQVIATERISLPARNSDSKKKEEGAAYERLAVQIETDETATVTAQLIPESFDALTFDNNALVTLPAPRPIRVYCPEDLISFRHALAGIKNVALFPNDGEGGSGAYDLVISDRREDLALTAPVAMYVGVIPKELDPLVSTETGLAELIDWDQTEPILRHVQLANVEFSFEPINTERVSAEDYERLGYEIIAVGSQGPLLLKKSVPASTAYYFLVHTELTTLPYRIGFPIMVSNLVRQTLRSASLLEVRAGRTGVLKPVPLVPNTEYEVTLPEGKEVTINTGADGLLAGVPAPAIGKYVVTNNGRQVAVCGASLVSSLETGMEIVKKLQFNEIKVEADAFTKLSTDKPLWRYFALAGLVVLMTEWWFFNRRYRRTSS